MPHDVILESSLANSHGWNFRSGKPSLWLRCDGVTHITTLQSETGLDKQWTDPLEALSWMHTYPFPDFKSRWVGYLSYDLGRLFESLPGMADNDLNLPLFYFALHDGHPTELDSPEPKPNTGELRSTLPRADYLKAVDQAICFIKAGDVFQVNLSQRFTTPLAIAPEQIWNKLPRAAYGAYLDCGDHIVLSNSPELFLRVDSDRRVTTRPIKGTRPRLPGMAEQLLESEKDKAELNMIIDLERNDLGRVCKPGSVKVTHPRSIESHPTVYHGVATIEGMLRDEISFVDLLRATFPGGSVTGAPKIRAMQIIEQLEPVRRGVYCGAIGYLAADGSMQFSVAIRTMVAKEGLIHIPVGGGIVADSEPEAEYDETLVKATAMFNSISVALPLGGV